jgi:hypothetical protein
MTWHVMVLMLACSPDLNTKKDSGNFPHQHTILALKKDTLNSWTNNQLNNLIATNVMEMLNLMRLLSILLTVYCHVPRILMILFKMVGGS